MSLQVWLPLNGDLHNQGLMPMTFSTTTANWNAAGKIGQAFSTLNSNIVGTCPNLNGVTTFSLTFWCFPKTNSSITTNWCNIIALGSKSVDNSTSAEFRFESSYGNTYILSHHNNAGEPIGGGTASLASERDKWYHVAVVANNESHTIRYYVNGVQLTTSGFLKTHNGGHLDGTIKLANESVDPDCLLNDVRIYDHALSAKEVEEIAKGLVLHYKLNDRFCEPTINLCSTSVGGWNNSGTCNRISNDTSIPNPPTSGAVYSVTATSDGSMALTAGQTPASHPSKTIIASTYVWLDGLQGTSVFYLRSSKTDGSVGKLMYNGNSNPTTWPLRQWIRITTAPITTASDATSFYICTYLTKNTEVRVINGWQIEEKDHVTPWVAPGTTRVAATIYDSSGYGNNGTIIGSLTTSTPSPRYSCATKFDGSSAIKVNDNNWMAQGASDLTVNIWAYMDNWSNWNGHRLYSCTEGGGFNIENTIANSLTFPVCVYTNTAHSTTGYIPTESRVAILKTDLISGWHMFTYIYTETKCQCYLDGVLYQTKPYTSYGVYFNMNGSKLFLGCEANGVNASGPYFIGNESDFRIYYTALTDTQVQELYKTSMLVSGNTITPRNLA